MLHFQKSLRRRKKECLPAACLPVGRAGKLESSMAQVFWVSSVLSNPSKNYCFNPLAGRSFNTKPCARAGYDLCFQCNLYLRFSEPKAKQTGFNFFFVIRPTFQHSNFKHLESYYLN